MSGRVAFSLLYKNNVEKLIHSAHGLLVCTVANTPITVDRVATVDILKDRFTKSVLNQQSGVHMNI